MKKSFTLTEILIVLVIISITIIIIPKVKVKFDKNINILFNLKKRLLDYGGDIKLICTDNCSKCLVFNNGDIVDRFKFVGESIIVYDEKLNEKVFDDYEDKFETKRVCLELSIKNKKFLDFIIEHDDKFYLYDAIDDTKIFDSISEIDDYKQTLIKEIKDGF